MEQRLTIIGLGVNDLKAATHFYEYIFGWEKLESSNESITFIKLNGILLSLYNREALAEDATVNGKGGGFKGFSLAYNTRTKEEVDTIISNLKQKGVTIIKPPQNVFWGGYSSYVSDLDNNLWEIAYNPFLPIDEDGNI
ncbi:VOC family protein [Flavobacteriaceae bacterium S0825]|uniref:VOC family protein n=1 Tax=Gaetbulibacter sp. S0825 TaxID=2720084 RepID=UPI00142F9237|nr:VOC family protein [Gaetbulibacter sp. S0825]MCK0110246.1 VOC family protein [Flavobacteriaceae bacterium S0825]NIX65874.1 VOC family protein [Gaetbulibacter sp. S0825]